MSMFDDEEGEEEVLDSSVYLNNCLRNLRFLQLLCENHHAGL